MHRLSVILASLLSISAIPSFAGSNDQSLHLDWIDKKIKPEQNFFEYANGSWQKKHPIPAAYSRWGVFEVLEEQNQQIIKNIINTVSKNPNNKPGSIEQKVGDFYFSGMDEVAIEKSGIKPLQNIFDEINQIKTLSDLQKTVTHLQLLGVNALFDFGQMQDYQDSNKVIGVAVQAGLGLPDRDYYLKPDAHFQKVRKTYQQHVTNMFKLLGDQNNKAIAEASTVMHIETALAKISMSRVDQRDPHAIYHMMDLNQLQQTTPQFSWKEYFTDVQHPEIKEINVGMPDFFKGMSTALTAFTIDDWKTYLRWHTINAFAPFLSHPFVNENFHMASALTGAKELLPRWKRVINTENGALGFAIGKLYVEKMFPSSSKEQAQLILNNIRHALRHDLENLSWMTPETRIAAIKKLDMMEERVGYPDQWRDYSALTIDRGPYVLNVIRANEFLNKRDLNKIGKPVDKNEWDMTPQEVNAYYDPSMNRINIPAGILQPPFFDPKAPAAVNYGSIGFVMGHEMTHGFDDEGSQFDGQGNLKNWWSPTDLKKFKQITHYISNQFSQYTVNGNFHIQGKLVLGEATADLGGLTLAYRAFHADDIYENALTIDNFTPDQQFFLGAAHVWALNIRPEQAHHLAVVDPHPPAIYRVNGTLANMPPFANAYHIDAKQRNAMVNKDHQEIW